MQTQKAKLIIVCLVVSAAVAGVPAKADSPAGYAGASVSISLTIAHPVRMQVTSEVICLYNYAERNFSIRQTQGTRAFDHNHSTVSRYQTVQSDQCKSGQALQLDAEPDRNEEYALLHVLIEPD